MDMQVGDELDMDVERWTLVGVVGEEEEAEEVKWKKR